jgi:hypothetical protein
LGAIQDRSQGQRQQANLNPNATWQESDLSTGWNAAGGWFSRQRHFSEADKWVACKTSLSGNQKAGRRRVQEWPTGESYRRAEAAGQKQQIDPRWSTLRDGAKAEAE